MLKRITIALFAVSASLAFAQLDSNSVTVTSSRSVNVQADQAVFAIFIDSGMDTTLNDVLTVLQPSGIGLGNFAGVGTVPQYSSPKDQQPPMLEWAFGLPVPLSKIKDTSAMLASLQKSVLQQNNGLTLSFNVQGTQVSMQLQQSQSCSIPDLLSDARAQAQKLADASGLSLGAVLAISSSTSTTPATGNLVGGLSIGHWFSTTTSGGFYPQSCFVTVKFALGR